ncbi:aldo/keto reductase [Flavivirga amylovorans]|uniref:Aldo/keto reductase n=1 Tax=Flavivirga amylovorans TaxID=870486 RepID=A0ABT8X1H8_9FLAO|nr:aldo/keto reductase [Flavivirga amylovorans]MDO5987563.1 aldo/keto reductase [Flavivirga amylovorans]
MPEGLSMVELALRWILDHPSVSCVIPGASSTKHVLSNTSVSNFKPLSEDTHRLLSNLYLKEIHQCIRGSY